VQILLILIGTGIVLGSISLNNLLTRLAAKKCKGERIGN
jgi:hypothetical protein